MSGERVAVVAGGPSTEAEVSRTSGRAVHAALLESGFASELLELDAELAQRLFEGRFAVVFPTTHGALGEDGCLQGLLEVLSMPYVGSGVLASALAMSKPHAKAQLAKYGLPLADDALLRRGDDLLSALPELRGRLGGALAIKPASGGSAIGVALLDADAGDAAIVSAVERALEADETVLIERCLRGHEVTCGVYERESGPVALPPTLITAKAGAFYDFTSKYQAGGSEHRCPAPFAPVVIGRVQALAVAAHRALGARDLSRVDFVVGDGADANSVTLLELNTLPGMTSVSLFPEAAAVAGIAFPELCASLVRRALARPKRAVPFAPAMP
jgi:D-alanine-D-alanine ligase